MRSFNVFLILMVVALFASGPAFAETVVFNDDFESQPAGSVSHAAYPDTTVAADPSAASVGTWVNTVAAVQDVQVTDYATPGAAAGNNYLRLMGRQLTSYAEATFEEQSTVGDTVCVEMDIFNPSGKFWASPMIKGYSAAGEEEWTVIGDGRGVDGHYGWTAFDGANYPPILGISPIEDVWTHLQFDWTLGDATVTMTLGTQVATVPVDVDSDGKIGVVRFYGGYYDGDLAYFDNVKVTVNPVPEPSSIALLASAILGLVACAWRKRR